MNIQDELLGWAHNEVEPPTSTEGVLDGGGSVRSSAEEDRVLRRESVWIGEPLPRTGRHTPAETTSCCECDWRPRNFLSRCCASTQAQHSPASSKNKTRYSFQINAKTTTICSRLKHSKPQLNLYRFALKSPPIFYVKYTSWLCKWTIHTLRTFITEFERLVRSI